MKKQTKNKFLILLICLLIQACSASNEQKGVVSSEDLTIQTTITTVTTVQDSPEIEDLTEEDFKDAGLETDLANYEMQKIIDANPALAAMLGRGEAPPSDVQPGRFDAGEGTAFDDLPKNKELMVGGEAGPTRDDAGFVEAQRVQAAREAMQDFRDSEPTEAEETAARRQRLLDERMMQDDMGNMEMIVGPGREQGFDDPIGLGAMPAGSGIPFRMDGPRVSNEYGGNTPFLRKMRDRIRKKFR